jgi:hypothetical protein
MLLEYVHDLQGLAQDQMTRKTANYTAEKACLCYTFTKLAQFITTKY